MLIIDQLLEREDYRLAAYYLHRLDQEWTIVQVHQPDKPTRKRMRKWVKNSPLRLVKASDFSRKAKGNLDILRVESTWYYMFKRPGDALPFKLIFGDSSG